ncbi:MAG: type II toxin-antitoxin system HipA family toxin [Staphylococcus sp.]|nr:type II toxin-antitoxin system HipA family toxin [Staphylococcus sp.]
MIEKLDVMLWGEKVGTLVSAKIGYGSKICFYFSPEYAAHGYDISPVRAPLAGIVAQRGLPVYPEEGKEFGGLPSFIADSMPDHWGNVVFAEWAKFHHIKMRDLTPLDRLAYIGRRGMGALEFVPPSSAEMEIPSKVEISELSKLAQKAIEEAKSFHVVMSPDFIIESLFKVGTSAGGRRPKAVINLNEATGECYSGQVATPKPGFVPMIIKFDEHCDIPTTRIEYSYYLMAVAAGMAMMPSKLIEGENEVHFLTERFDRKDGDKIHVQTLAAMNPMSSSYEDLFETAFQLGLDASEIKRLFMQMVMNVAGGNVDDHNKNFSFLMGRDGRWHVAPAYDYTFTVDMSAPFYVNRHSLTINGKNQQIGKEDLEEVGRCFNIKGVSEMIERAVTVTSGYRSYAYEAGVPEYWAERIAREIESRGELL